jgi:hypothetical protein
MWQLSECIDGMAEACRALAPGHRGQRQPLQRERRGRHRPDAGARAARPGRRAARAAARAGLAEGDTLVLLGARAAADGSFPLDGTRWATERRQHRGGTLPASTWPRHGACAPSWPGWSAPSSRAITPPLLSAVHDVSSGGLAVALAEMAVAAGTGCAVALERSRRALHRAAVALRGGHHHARRAVRPGGGLGIPPFVLGRAGGDRFTVGDLLDLPWRPCARPTRGIWPTCWGIVRVRPCARMGHREGSLRCLRCLRPRAQGGQPHLRRPLRAAAPRPGVGRHGGQRRRHGHRGQGHGPGGHRLRRAQALGPAGASGHRPHPLLDPRGLGLGRRPAGLPARRPGRLRPRPQRQPDQHHRAGREGRHAARVDRHRQRRGGRAAGPRLPRDRGAGRRAAGRAAHCRGRLLLRPDEHAEALRRARPLRLPAAVPGPPRPGRRARGLGAGLGDARPQRHRRHLRARDRARRAGGHRRRRRAQPADPVAQGGHPAAVHLRVRLHRPPDSQALRARGPRDPLPHGRAAGGAGPGGGRPGHGRARVGRPGGRGVRPGQRHPLRAGPGEEPLHRAHLHRPRPAGPRRRVRRKLNPLPETIAGKRSWWWTTPSCGAPRSARWCACCARPGPPRCTCGSRRRRGAGPASTASTRRRPTSCWRPTTASRR